MENKNILVTGGAGYIGSITVKRLLEEGYGVTVFDNMKNGHKEAISCSLIEGDLLNRSDFELLKDAHFDAIVHFAASALAGESMQNPYQYFQNNIQGGLNLIEYAKNKSIKNFIFSSTCAIYGTPEVLPVTEKSPKHPESVYGESKLSFENILRWYDEIFGIKHINLRYFNAAGASLDGTIGEAHSPETHIIPIAIQAAMGKISEFTMFGDDYPTEDGSCVRDYIHVLDLANAHILALKKLSEDNNSDSFNLGTGVGYSNKQIIDMVKKISGKDFPVRVLPRREGDPPMIFADNTKAKEILGFNPQYSDLETIIKSACEFHNKNYEAKLV